METALPSRGWSASNGLGSCRLIVLPWHEQQELLTALNPYRDILWAAIQSLLKRVSSLGHLIIKALVPSIALSFFCNTTKQMALSATRMQDPAGCRCNPVLTSLPLPNVFSLDRIGSAQINPIKAIVWTLLASISPASRASIVTVGAHQILASRAFCQLIKQTPMALHSLIQKQWPGVPAF